MCAISFNKACNVSFSGNPVNNLVYGYEVKPDDLQAVKLGKNVANYFALKDESNLSGLELAETKLHNGFVVAQNPFTAVEFWKKMGNINQGNGRSIADNFKYEG